MDDHFGIPGAVCVLRLFPGVLDFVLASGIKQCRLRRDVDGDCVTLASHLHVQPPSQGIPTVSQD